MSNTFKIKDKRILELDPKKYSKIIDDSLKATHPILGVVASEVGPLHRKMTKLGFINKLQEVWSQSHMGTYSMVTSKKAAKGIEYLRSEYYGAIARLKDARTKMMSTDLWKRCQEEQAEHLRSEGKYSKENMNSIISEIAKRIWIDRTTIVQSIADINPETGNLGIQDTGNGLLEYTDLNHDSLVAAIAAMNIYLEMNKEFIATGNLPEFAEEEEECHEMPEGLKDFLDAASRGEIKIPGMKVIKGDDNMLKHLMKQARQEQDEDDDKKVWN